MESEGGSTVLSRRVERLAMAEKVEAERESRMEKAEEESERMKSRRQMSTRILCGWRVDICEAEASRAETEREEKKVELEFEKDLDSQRMEVVQTREAMGKACEEADGMKTRTQRRRQNRRRRQRVKMDEERTEAEARRVKMDEERMEAEASRAESEREAKKVELELEKVLDSQRMEAEVERWLAKFQLEKEEMEAEMEAEKKWMDKCKRIFRVWWDAWKAKEQEYQEGKGEDHKTWLLRVRSLSSPLMAVWEPWESDYDDLYIEISGCVSLKKLNELLLNNWKDVEFGRRNFLEELKDVELMPYCRKYIDFRNYWEAKYGHGGQFEYITKLVCMRFSYRPVPRYVFKGPRPKTLQVFSVWIEGSSWPLKVYGLIAVRDFIDPYRNMVFNRDRDDCQIVTKEDPYLLLTGPTHSVVVDMNESMGPVTIEAELKVKGAVESEDKYIILDAIKLPALDGSSLFELAGPHMRLRISLGAIQKSVEATIFIRVVNGTWPPSFHGRFIANTASIDCNEVILLEFSGDGEMKQSRHVVSVEASGILMVTLKNQRGEEVRSVIFNAVDRGKSSQTINVGFCSVEVIVAWSLIFPYREDLVPFKYMELYDYQDANEDSWESGSEVSIEPGSEASFEPGSVVCLSSK